MRRVVGEVVEFEIGDGGALEFEGDAFGWECGGGGNDANAVGAGEEFEKAEASIGVGAGAREGFTLGVGEDDLVIGSGVAGDEDGAADFQVGGVGIKRGERRAEAPAVEHRALFGAGDVGGEGGVGQGGERGDEFAGAALDLSEADDGVARIGGRGILGGVGEGALGAGEAFADGGEFGGAQRSVGAGLTPRPVEAGAVGAPLRGEEDAAEMRDEERPVLVEGAAGDGGQGGRRGGVKTEFDGGAPGAGRARVHGAAAALPVSRVTRGQR